MAMNLKELQQQIEAEIDSYAYVHPENAKGRPMPSDWVAAQLAEFKEALVEPTWRVIAIRDTVEQMCGDAKPEFRRCILVADDRKGYELYFDPPQNEYVLAYSGDPPTTFNVRGDAVGCFMSR